jgi:peptide-methionine (S)-S-oxide reductase
VEPIGRFFPAEDYHQKYLEKTPGGYCHINLSLGKPGEHK